MKIIDQLKGLLEIDYTDNQQLEDYFDNEQKYDKLIFNITSSSENQHKICDFVLNNSLKYNEKGKFIHLLLELYRAKEQDELLYFESLYEWILNTMFDIKFYQYSICYKFSELLWRISHDSDKVYEDIINHIDIYNTITTQIAVCSTYTLSNKFFKNEVLTKLFINKISDTLKNHYSNELIEDFNHFMLKPLISFSYEEEIQYFKIQ